MCEKTDLAYLAGVMDSDGCFSIHKGKISSGNRRVNPTYQITCILTQTDKTVVSILADLYSANIQVREYKNTNRKPVYRFGISGKKAESFIEKILPYLKIKQSQAKLLLKLQKNINDKNNFSRTSHTTEVIDFREKLYQQNKVLNQRGVN